MRHRKSYLGILLLIIGLLSFCNLVIADDPEIKISASRMRPGDFIKIIGNEPEDSVVSARFLGNTKQLVADHNKYIGLMAASYYTTPGIYTLAVTITKDDQSYTKEYKIEVIKRLFPESRIWVPEKTRKEILTPENRNSDTLKATDARQKAVAEVSPPLWEGAFIRPLKGRLTTNFGLIRYVNNIENGRHSGLDIAAPKGTPVIASNRGQVIFAGNLYLTGLTVIVYHGLDLFSTYCHLSAINVKEGDLITREETVGLVGATGLATGPHLHLTFRIGDTSVDPYLFLEQEVSWDY